MARRRVPGMVTVVGAVAALVGSLLTASPASAAGPPVVKTIALSSTTVAAPGQVTLAYTATVDSPVTSATGRYIDPKGVSHYVDLTPGASGSGPLMVRDGQANGTWLLSSLALFSSAGETLVCRSENTDTQCTDRRDLTPYDVLVSGSQEDFTAPLLTGVTVTPTQVAPGDEVTVSWSFTDPHGLDGMRLRLENKRAVARGDAAIFTPTADELAKGSMKRLVSSARFNGDYELVSVGTIDTLGNTAVFNPDGTAAPRSPATGPTHHTVDFASVRFTVSGSVRDEAPPVLQSLTRAADAPTAGQPLSLAYAATDASGIQSLTITVANPDRTISTPTASSPVGTNGTVTYVPTNIGAYRITLVKLIDTNGYAIEYRPDGTTRNPLTGEVGRHSLDLAALDFTALPSELATLGVQTRSGSAGITWTVAEAQARDITGYQLVVNPGGRVIDLPPSGDFFAYTDVHGLTNGVRYTFSVTPKSAVGEGPPRSVDATPVMSSDVFRAGDVNGDGRDDLWAFLHTTDAMRLYGGTGAPGYQRGIDVETLSGARYFPGGKVGAYSSFLLVNRTGRLSEHWIDKNARVAHQVVVSDGWGGMKFIDGAADFTGDGVADVVAVTSTGVMRLYKGIGRGGIAPGTQIGTGWGSMARVFATGDVTGDRKPDVAALDQGGVLWIYPGNGRGGWLPRVKVGSGWGGLGTVFSAGDATRDGKADIGAITMKGELRIYKGRGNGTFTGATVVGTGWGSFL